MHEMPGTGLNYIDSESREFLVEHTDMRDRLDRNVQGIITVKDRHYAYSCSLQIWADIWRDKTPRLDPNRMKIG